MSSQTDFQDEDNIHLHAYTQSCCFQVIPVHFAKKSDEKGEEEISSIATVMGEGQAASCSRKINQYLVIILDILLHFLQKTKLYYSHHCGQK